MRAIIMLCLGLWAALLLNPGEVYAQRGLPGQVALGVNGGIADGFFYGTHALPISICVPVIRSNSRLYLVIRFSSNTFSSIPTLSGL